ncbi:MAG: adenosine deaminase [Chloroflexi bacterium]|nr:MAG: adenosine deaminase [Chloroflexota bacterium]
MSIESFIEQMPKVELHVHLEGATQPKTLLELAQRHHIDLPADTVDGIQKWYTFTNFAHFVEIYLKISECIRTPEDIEYIAREFLAGQAAQNIRYTEVTYTPYTHWMQKGLEYDDQLDALNRARAWAEEELGVSMGIIMDIPREITPELGMMTADWVIGSYGNGVIALGLGGNEVGNPPEKHAAAFERALAAGVPSIPHAGETAGPESIWGALNILGAQRIGHGVRCLEDPTLVDELRERQIPLEVCPTSNVCLGVAPSIDDHPVLMMFEEDLYVTINSDDPPMFNTTLTQEYLAVMDAVGLIPDEIERLVIRALDASLLPRDIKAQMKSDFEREFKCLDDEHLSF